MHTACLKQCFFTSPCDFHKNVMSELLSPPSVTIPSSAHHPFAKPSENIASMPCWATTTQKHAEKVNFNGRNQIGRPTTLHSHSKDGWPDRTVTMRWITSNMMYSKDKLTVSVLSSWCKYISISTGNYLSIWIENRWCKSCHAQIKYAGGNTTNLRNHISRFHPVLLTLSVPSI